MSAILAGIFLCVKGLISEKRMQIVEKEVEKNENNFSTQNRKISYK